MSELISPDHPKPRPELIAAVYDFWWRSLADAGLPHAASAAGTRRKVTATQITAGHLPLDVAQYLRRRTDERPPKEGAARAIGRPIDILVCPTVLTPAQAHGASYGSAGSRDRSGPRGAVVAPLYVPARLLPSGHLLPPDNLKSAGALIPWFARPVLFPEIGTFPCVGDLERFDAARSQLIDLLAECPPGARSAAVRGDEDTEMSAPGSPLPDPSWKWYWEKVSGFCEQVTGKQPFSIACEDWRLGEPMVLGDVSAYLGRQVLSVIESLRGDPSPEADRIAWRAPDPAPLPASVIGDALDYRGTGRTPSPSLHLAHVNGAHGLVSGQRAAARRALSADIGQVLPVSGPPGTGKTALLLDIVASRFVASALEGRTTDHPPLTMVASGNNRAIENALDAFARPDGGDGVALNPDGRPITTRWLPPALPPHPPGQTSPQRRDSGVAETGTSAPVTPSRSDDLDLGYAQWLISYSKRDDAGGYPSIHRDRDDLRGDVFALDSADYVARATRHFLESYGDADRCRKHGHTCEGVEWAVEEIRRRIDRDVALLLNARRTLGAALDASASGPVNSLRHALTLARRRLTERTHAPAAAVRRHAANIALSRATLVGLVHENRFAAHDDWRQVNMTQARHELGIYLAGCRGLARAYRDLDLAYAEESVGIVAAERRFGTGPHGAIDTLWLFLSKVSGLWPGAGAPPDLGNRITGPLYDQVEQYLDRSLRNRLWHLACRYWEGRWILATASMVAARDARRLDDIPATRPNDGKRRSGAYDDAFKAMATGLGRLSMLTPCFASTWSNLFQVLAWSDSSRSRTRPLVGVLDLVLADEAGQTPATLGVPGLAFAKRAIVIGDIAQLRPVATSTEIGDRVSWRQAASVHGLSERQRSALFDRMKRAGLLPSAGSLMDAALSAHAASRPLGGPPDPAPRLRMHFRSVPEICDLVSTIAYSGAGERLIPGRPAILGPRPWPSVGFIDVLGFTETINGGKRNVVEARRLAAWLAENREKLSACYPDRPLEDIVAVLTPYRSQADALWRAMADAGVKTAKPITVGTVFALQGAERPVILMSTVGTTAQELHYASGVNMVNVSVSRARDHLIVFADPTEWYPKTPGALGPLADLRRADPRRILSVAAAEIAAHGEADDDPRHQRPERREILSTLTGHRVALAEAFAAARRRLVIVSPYITLRTLDADHICARVKAAVARRVEVIVVYDARATHEQPTGDRAVQRLAEAGAVLLDRQPIHKKVVVVDCTELTMGSFNWLSSVREEGTPYSYQESSTRIAGGAVVRQNILDEFVRLSLPPYPGALDAGSPSPISPILLPPALSGGKNAEGAPPAPLPSPGVRLANSA